MLSFVLLTLFTLLVLATLRLLYILPGIRGTPRPPPAKRSSHAPPAHLMILLGSGGHTAEMLLLLSAVTPEKAQHIKRTYIITTDDNLSLHKAAAHEVRALSPTPENCVIRFVPRARRVGQSWVSTPWDCVLCLLGCVQAFVHGGIPDVVVCNGPGSAVLMVLVALACRFIGVADTRTVYVESFARTRTLSLSGRILYPLVDRFLVQWPKLKDRYPRAEYRGILV